MRTNHFSNQFRLAKAICALAVFAAQSAFALPPVPPGGDPPAPRDPLETKCVSGARGNLTALPATASFGQRVTVRWSVSLPKECDSVGYELKLNDRRIQRDGSESIIADTDRSYRLTIRTDTSSARSIGSAQIVVNYPTDIRIDQSTPNPVAVFMQALRKSTKISLCNVDLDLTNAYGLELRPGQQLFAAAGCERSATRFGPRLHITRARGTEDALLTIRGSNVTISGLTIEGPTSGTGSGTNNIETGIEVCITDATDPTPVQGILISNVDVHRWSGAGIEVVGTNWRCKNPGRMSFANVGGVTIENSFIHHNRHYDGYGYGVVVSNGGYALIRNNVFDFNRHAIAGDSRSDDGTHYSGYKVQGNLILAGGGVHCHEGLTSNFPCWQTHQIDMHGTESDTFYSHCCGIAGETLLIEYNTILYTAGEAIKVRGDPLDTAIVEGNVFAHSSEDDAIEQNATYRAVPDPLRRGVKYESVILNPIHAYNNIYGVHPATQTAACDFDGDGIKDSFMATGITWWYKSGVTQQWRYLNAMTDSGGGIIVGDFNGDGKCDVAKRPSNVAMVPVEFSWNGTSRWLPRAFINQ
jgi:hypothetical protein